MSQTLVLFEKLFESLPDSVVIVDAEGRIAEANERAEKAFGYTRFELLRLPVEALIPERFRAAHPGHRAQFQSQPSVRPMGIGLELYGRRKDGTEFPVDIMLSPVETSEGRVVLTVIRDVSERRQIETALSQLSVRFQSLVAAVKDYAIFMLDSQGRVSTWNAGAQRLKGYRPEEIIGQHFSRFYTPEDLQAGIPDSELQTAAAVGRAEVTGWRVKKDGSRFWANGVTTSIRNEKGELVCFAKVTRDFTERLQIEEAMRASESRYRSLFEFSPDAIIVTDERGTISDVNGQVDKFFGYDRRELLGQPIETLVPERFRQAHPAHREGYYPRSQIRPMGIGLELYARRKDGTEFPVDIMLSPVETGRGKVILSVVRDLSEKKRVEEALAKREQEKRYLEEELQLENSFDEIVGDGPELRRVLKQVETVAATEATVLILGETGTGKDLVARAIHHLSPRREHTLVKLNCAAIPTGLLESELFGHEKGAFTGAISQKIGRLELADGGTLFLDEVGDLPLELQPKLLRALQEKEFERLGGTRTIPANVRLVAATNRDLGKMVADKQFRSDLYYRLRVFPITIPSLRERRGDIPQLVAYFVDKYARQLDRKIESIPPETMQALVRWSWPGNIRELENFIERAVILSKGPALRAPLAELEIIDAEAADPPPAVESLETAEREHILRVLRETKGVTGGAQGAAARLKLKRTTLNSKLKKLGIGREDYT